jgi:hypothetical protein
VANQSNFCARSSAAAAGATSPIAGLQSAPGQMKVGIVFSAWDYPAAAPGPAGICRYTELAPDRFKNFWR